MSDRPTSIYAETLNGLHEMASSLAYALRRNTLRAAERIIVDLEQEVKRLKEPMGSDAAIWIAFRKVEKENKRLKEEVERLEGLVLHVDGERTTLRNKIERLEEEK